MGTVVTTKGILFSTKTIEERQQQQPNYRILYIMEVNSHNDIINTDNETKYNRFATVEQRRRKEMYDTAQRSLQDYISQHEHDDQEQEHEGLTTSESKRNHRLKAKRIVQKGWKKVRTAIQKVNIGSWIDDLEHDQHVADELDRINNDTIEEVQRNELVKHVHQLCMNAIQDHLISYHKEHPNGTYEEWIAELHPENVIVPKQNNDNTTAVASSDDNDNDTTGTDNNSTSGGTHSTESSVNIRIDPRFYVEDSDHLMLWNQMMKNETNQC